MINTLFSIIVPVYKVEKYLSTTLDSILLQTFTDWECILVDDGSPDNSGAICDKYAMHDQRFVVIHKENEGVSAARNSGILVAKGEWLIFLDSDDTWNSSLLSDLAHIFSIERNVQLFSFGYKYIKPEQPVNENVFKEGKCSGQDFFANCYHDAAWAYLFKRELVEKWDVRFPQGIRYSEDQCFTCKYLLNNPTCYTIERAYYNYYFRETSACGQTKTVENYADNLRVAVEIAKYAETHKNVSSAFSYRVIIRFFSSFLWYMIRLESYDHQHATALYRDAYREVIKRNISFIKNVRLLFCYFFLNRYIKHLKQGK